MCGGKGCHYCNGGELTIEHCPLKLMTRDMELFFRFADLYEKGLPPYAGGALDQPWAFITMCDFYFAEKTFYERQLRMG